jgi:hypothetical protein
MKLVGVIAVLVGGAALVGCNGGGARAKAPNDVFELAQEELSHTIGTTSLSSANLAGPRARKELDPASDVYPDEAAAPTTRTWGSAPSEQQTAESDLAGNPYTTAAPRDIYDPR